MSISAELLFLSSLFYLNFCLTKTKVKNASHPVAENLQNVRGIGEIQRQLFENLQIQR